MATCPDERFRDADRALRAAQRAVELLGNDDFRYLDTWAAAHANDGKFEQAIETLDKAISIAPDDEVETLKRRKALYQQNEPYRQGMFQQLQTGR